MGSADELRLALRRLLKRPAATLAAVVTLAVSIGAATATWSLLSAVLLRPLPVAGADRLMVVGTQVMQGRDAGTLRTTHVYPYYPHIRDSAVFESVAAQWLSPPQLLVSTGGVPVQTSVGFATHNFFDVLGVRIPVGRNFTGEDDRRGAAPVAILTERYWRRVFEGSNAVIGRTITMAGKPVTIVGVAAPGFRGLDLAQAPDLYLPFHTVADVTPPGMNYFAEPNQRMSPTSGTMVIGRLRARDQAESAASRLTTLGPPPEYKGSPPRYGLTPVNAAAVPQPARAGMSLFGRLLGTTVGLLLLIGCGTVGLLLLIRTEARREEFAMCLALGASRTRLARGVTLEGAMLAAAGALLALPVSGWLFNGARAFQLPGGVSIGLLELTIDRRALVTAIACAALTTLGIALIAATLGFARDLTQELRGRAGATPRLTRRPTRTALVAAQVAVAVALLAGTGLFVRSLQTALGLNSGLDVERLVTGQLFLGAYGYNASRTSAFFEDLAGRLNGNPAIRSMAFSAAQGGMSAEGRLVIDGEPRQFPSMVRFEAIDEHYFATMGIPILAGRGFSADDRAPTPLVTIVSASFGRQLAAGGDPIGRRITMPSSTNGQSADVREVIGVVGDVVTNVSVLEPLAMYLPLARTTPSTITARAMSDADAARREMLSAIRQIDSAITPPPMLTMEERITRQMAAQQFGALVMGSLGFIAILLTLLGTYVVAESLSVMRTRELGIRAALGARGAQLAGIVLAETGRLVGIGLIIGLAIVWAGASTIRAFLFGVRPLDPATLATVGSSILVLAMIVSTRPALRAARVDLGKVLRTE